MKFTADRSLMAHRLAATDVVPAAKNARVNPTRSSPGGKSKKYPLATAVERLQRFASAESKAPTQLRIRDLARSSRSLCESIQRLSEQCTFFLNLSLN